MPYHTIDGDDGEYQYFTALYMLGYEDIQATDFKLGLADLATNKNHITNGNIEIDGKYKIENHDITLEIIDGEHESTLYPQKVVEEQLNIELIHINDSFHTEGTNTLVIERFSAKYPQTVEIEFTVEGLIGYTSSGAKQDKSIKIGLEVSLDNGKTYELFAIPAGWSNSGSTVITLNGESTYISGTATITRQKNKVMKFVARRTFTFDEAKKIIQDGKGYAEFRIVRINPKDNETNTSDTIYLSGIRTWSFDKTKSFANGNAKLIPQAPVIESKRKLTTRIALRIKADEYVFKNQLDSLNCIVESKCRTWDKIAKKWSTNLTTTNNPAAIALMVLQHKSRGKFSYSDDMIDLDKFGEFYDWCNQERENFDGTKSPKFTCNGVLTNQKKTRDIINAILEVGRARLIINDDKYSIWIDKPQDYPVMVLNNQNVISASNSKEFKELPNGYLIKFVNEKNGYQSDERKVCFNDEDENNPDAIFDNLEMLFCTDEAQIYQNGKYRLACAKLRPETWTRKVSIDGYLLDIGSMVSVQDDTISVGIGDGAEIKEVIIKGDYIIGIKTDGRFEVIDINETYGVKITQTSSYQSAPIVIKKEVIITEKGRYADFIFTEPISLNEAQTPCIGDILSFGIYDRITTEALVFGRKDNGDGTFDLTLTPYQEGIYTCDSGKIPEFDSKVTNITDAVIGNFESKKATVEDVQTIKNEFADGTTNIGNPDNVSNLQAIADKDNLIITFGSFGSGLRNSIDFVQVDVKTTKESEWETYYTSSNTVLYQYNRDKIGYLEFEDFTEWRVRAKARNIYGLESEWVECTVNTDSYGTWKLSKPNIVVRNSNRTVTLLLSQKERSDSRAVYGEIKYAVQIRKTSSEEIFFKPNVSSDPYLDGEDCYKVLKDTKGFISCDGVYIQTLPLDGQDDDNIKDTTYTFKVWAYTEAGQGDYETVTTSALCDSLRDIVKANEDFKSLYVEKLSAISANLGVIKQGSLTGSDYNFWALSTLTDDLGKKRYQGAMRVGGQDEYLEVIPRVNNREQIIGYHIDFKVGNFSVTSEASSINGELVVQEDEDSLDRTRITSQGTYYEHRNRKDLDWYDISKLESKGLKSEFIYSHRHLIMANADISLRRKLGHDIGRPLLSSQSKIYHFDTDLYDQNGNLGYTYTGAAILKGEEDNTSIISFTPAILAVAPYAEIGKSLYGQYTLSHTIGISNSWTVDFWVQYIWAENQILFSIGNEEDKIEIVISTGEPNFNEPLEDEPPFNTEQTLTGALCFNVALGEGTYITHVGLSKKEILYLNESPFNLKFEANQWLHFGITMNNDELKIYINKKMKIFKRFSRSIFANVAEFNLNPDNSFMLDELMIDSAVSENFDDFAKSTDDKIPFGNLDYKKDYFILDVKDLDNFKTNIFDSEIFKNAVKNIIEEEKGEMK